MFVFLKARSLRSLTYERNINVEVEPVGKILAGAKVTLVRLELAVGERSAPEGISNIVEVLGDAIVVHHLRREASGWG